MCAYDLFFFRSAKVETFDNNQLLLLPVYLSILSPPLMLLDAGTTEKSNFSVCQRHTGLSRGCI